MKRPLPLPENFAPAPRNGGFRMSEHWVWCPSVIRNPEDGRHHMFASRIPRGLPFHPGWMVASEIVRATSDTPEGPYTFAEVVLPARGAQYWDGRSTHNPRILRWRDRYLLYYMGSTHPFEDPTPDNAHELTLASKWCVAGRANKRVGLAWSPSLEGPWHRMDETILPTRPNTFYSFLTSNPAPVLSPDGGIQLLFKARAYKGNRHGNMTIGLAVAEHPFGPYAVINTEPLFSNDQFGEIEDPFLWHDETGYHLIAKDMRGVITKSAYGGGLLAHSPDALHWSLDPEPLAYSREIGWDDGTRAILGHVERPFLLLDDEGKPSHLFLAAWDEPGGFMKPTPDARAWNLVVPLTARQP